jgi:hypothetical protein
MSYSSRGIFYNSAIFIQRAAALTELPHQNTLRTKTRLNACINNYKMRDIYAKSIRINKAVATIQRREFIYYANTTKYEVSAASLKLSLAALRKLRGQVIILP